MEENNATTSNIEGPNQILLLEVRKMRILVAISIGISALCLILIAVVVTTGIVLYQKAQPTIQSTAPLLEQMQDLDVKKLSEDIGEINEVLGKVDWDSLNESISALDIDALNTTMNGIDVEELSEAIATMNSVSESMKGLFSKFSLFGGLQ